MGFFGLGLKPGTENGPNWEERKHEDDENRSHFFVRKKYTLFLPIFPEKIKRIVIHRKANKNEHNK